MPDTKRIALSDIASYVNQNDRVWIGGWTIVRKPMAMVFELIRAQKKQLHIVNNPGGPDTDLLIGSGCVSKTETNYIGHEVFGHPYNFRRQMEQTDGSTDFHHDDWTVGSGTLRIMAGAMGIPFIPTRFLMGSDMLDPALDGFKSLRGHDPKVPKRKYTVMKDPFWNGDDVVLIPALNPDVCLIHAQEVGEDGTARISGGAFLDYYAAVASQVTIVSAEKILPTNELIKTREENVIPGDVVDAIVEVPFGAHPTAVCECYDNDPWWFREYLAASKNKETMQQWVEQWILEPADFAEYLAKIGTNRLNQLVADPEVGYASKIKRRLDKLEAVD